MSARRRDAMKKVRRPAPRLREEAPAPRGAAPVMTHRERGL